MSTVDLGEWSVVYASNDVFQAPEQNVVVLIGRVHGHPRKSDGTMVQTSRIKSVEGRVIHTHSGTVYRLGNPSEGYREWLRTNRPKWDPENPITIMTGARC